MPSAGFTRSTRSLSLIPAQVCCSRRSDAESGRNSAAFQTNCASSRIGLRNSGSILAELAPISMAADRKYQQNERV
jgi:hypothetical protein